MKPNNQQNQVIIEYFYEKDDQMSIFHKSLVRDMPIEIELFVVL